MVSVTVVDAEVRVWHEDVNRTNPGDPQDDPDAVIGGPDLEAFSLSTRAGEVRDEASIDAHRGPYDLRVGDRVEWETTISPTGGGEYGEDYGDGYGGGTETLTWTGRVQPTNEKIEDVQHGQLSVDATDWPGAILAERTVTGAWEGVDVGEIIRDIVDRVASEVDASNIPDFGETTDQFFQARDAWDAVVSLAAKGDVVLSQVGNELHADPIPDLTPEFTLQTQDYRLPFDVTTEDQIKNVVRVDSGVSRQQEDAQETTSNWRRVTETDRLSTEIRARKSQVHSVEIYVDRVLESGDDLRVRLQADEGGTPIAPEDSDSDIVSQTWGADELPEGGWKNFFFGDHTLPERSVWLIVEATGPDGHDVAVDDAGILAYRSYYPHPLNFEVTAGESIDRYGAREIAIEKKNLQTISATRDAAYAELARRAWPEKVVSFPARSTRIHDLDPGQVFTIDNDRLAEPGDYIVMEKTQTFDSSTVNLETILTATWRKGVLAPIR